MRPFLVPGRSGRARVNPDGTRVVTASGTGGNAAGENLVRVWNAADGTILGPPMTHGSGVISTLMFSPDGSRIASASNQTVHLWDSDGHPVGRPLEHADTVAACAFSPDASILGTASEDKTIKLWGGADGRPIGYSLKHDAGVKTIAFHPSGRRLVSVSNGHVWEWQVPAPVPGTPERLAMWTTVLTGKELGVADSIQTLDIPTWQDRLNKLTALGGPPDGFEWTTRGPGAKRSGPIPFAPAGSAAADRGQVGRAAQP